MEKPTLFGLIEFSTPLYCSADALGQAIDISIGGHVGTLTLPSLPNWSKQKEEPLAKSLLGPIQARTWKKGENLIYWGSLNSYPQGDATVLLALMEFPSSHDHLESDAQKIYEGFGIWLKLFEEYVILLTTQNTRNNVSVSGESKSIEILTLKEARLKYIPRTTHPIVTIESSDVDKYLHLEQLIEAARLSSKSLPPRFQYQLILEAYKARKDSDYRKAIVEAANALEACLTERIMEEFDRQRLSFGEKLLQKFRMLGGRFELVKLLGIALPNKDYESLINKPRNDVIHRGAFPDKKLANQVITEVEELLRLFSPQVQQDAQES